MRETHYRRLAHEELMLPEGGLHDKILEDHFFGSAPKQLPYILTALPENFRSADFFELRRRWGLADLEIRDEICSREAKSNRTASNEVVA